MLYAYLEDYGKHPNLSIQECKEQFSPPGLQFVEKVWWARVFLGRDLIDI
jgi:hypothetical protein